MMYFWLVEVYDQGKVDIGVSKIPVVSGPS